MNYELFREMKAQGAAGAQSVLLFVAGALVFVVVCQTGAGA